MNGAEQLNSIFIRHWKKPSLISDERSFNYCDLYSHALAICEWLNLKGCQAGDTVAIKLPNGWPFAISYLACIIGGVRFVPVNLELSEQDQRYIIERVNAKFVIDNAADLLSLQSIQVDKPGFFNSSNTVAAVFFTSGTTGRPKGVCHTLENLINNVLAFNQAQNINNHTRMYHILPMAYMAGFLNTLLSPWLAGGVVLLGTRFRPLDALQFWEKPLLWNANAIWLTPTIAAVISRMNRSKDIIKKLATKEWHIFCGTAPLPIKVRENFRVIFGLSLQESYGMSEILLVASQTIDEADKEINVGRLLPNINIRFRRIPESRESELIIDSPYALSSYLLEDSEKSPLLEDGGMPTGDIGLLLNKALIITGRLKDLIIRGGVNISPFALENILQRESNIKEAAAIGLPHEIWGECIVACLVIKKNIDSEMLQLNIQKRCTEELAEGMRPDYYVFLDNFPYSSTGKVQKHILVKRLTQLVLPGITGSPTLFIDLRGKNWA